MEPSTGIELVLVLPGSFIMGTSSPHDMFGSDERPAHEVEISKPYYIGRYEVTRGQYARGVGRPTPLGWHYEEAYWVFLSRTNSSITRFLANTGFRLPTEAEWEYACRFGFATPGMATMSGWYKRILRSAWFDANSKGEFHAVGMLEPNGIGLYDMLGNAPELCRDYYDPMAYAMRSDGVVDPVNLIPAPSRIVRGGSFAQTWSFCRPGLRDSMKLTDDVYEHEVGFRVVRNP